MKPKEAVNFFKTRTNLSNQLGLNSTTVWYWLTNKHIPTKWQIKIAELTNYELQPCADLITIDQIYALIEKFGKSYLRILKISNRNFIRWEKAGTIPYVTQRRIVFCLKKQEKKHASSTLFCTD
jgi:hypothetical protein